MGAVEKGAGTVGEKAERTIRRAKKKGHTGANACWKGAGGTAHRELKPSTDGVKVERAGGPFGEAEREALGKARKSSQTNHCSRGWGSVRWSTKEVVGWESRK